MRRPGWLAALAVTAACAGGRDGVRAGDLELRDARVMAPPTTSEAAAYVTVANRGPVADTLVDVIAAGAGRTMLHRQVTDGDVTSMEHVDRLAIPARDSVVMAPGHLHIMLLDLAGRPAVGDSVTLEFTFTRGGVVAVRAPVRPYGN